MAAQHPRALSMVGWRSSLAGFNDTESPAVVSSQAQAGQTAPEPEIPARYIPPHRAAAAIAAAAIPEHPVAKADDTEQVDEGQPRQEQQDASVDSSTHIYIGNLKYTAQYGEIEAFFKDNGFKPSGLRLRLDPRKSGRNLSYGFMNLGQAEEVQRAKKELDGKPLLGRPIKINDMVARKSHSGENEDAPAGEHRSKESSGNGSGKGGAVLHEVVTASPLHGHSTYWLAPSREGRRIYLGGVPHAELQGAMEAAVHNLFALAGLHAPQALSKTYHSPRITTTTTTTAAPPVDRYRYLFIEVASREEAARAIEVLDGKIIPWGAAQLHCDLARAKKAFG